jgi:hypothetical protein
VGRVSRVGYFTSFLVNCPQCSNVPGELPVTGLIIAMEEEKHPAPQDKWFWLVTLGFNKSNSPLKRMLRKISMLPKI